MAKPTHTSWKGNLRVLLLLNTKEPELAISWDAVQTELSKSLDIFLWKSQILSSNSASTLGNSAVLSSDLRTYISKADRRTLPPTFKTEATWPTKEGLEDIICIKVYREEKEVVSWSETASYSFHNLEIVT